MKKVELRMIIAFIIISLMIPYYALASDQSTGNWIIKTYVDEFKMPTDIQYITTLSEIEGTFSNSAVQDEELTVQWLIDKDNVAIKLFEYGKFAVTGYSNKNIRYLVRIRYPSGEKQNLYATLYKNTDRLLLEDEYEETVKRAFATNDSVMFYIQNLDRENETYLFSVENIYGFARMWKQISGENESELMGEITVYYGERSPYYHSKSNCPRISVAIPHTLNEAVLAEKEACPDCNPPVLPDQVVSSTEPTPAPTPILIDETSDQRDIIEVQQLLADRGWLPTRFIDGIWGERTEQAITAFQKFVNQVYVHEGEEPLNEDGVCDEATLNYLRRDNEHGGMIYNPEPLED